MNLETGLPDLPEGYYWHVNETSVDIRAKLPDTAWSKQEGQYWHFYPPGYCGHLVEGREVEYEVPKRWGVFTFKRTVKVREHRLIQRWERVASAGSGDMVTRKNILALCEEALEVLDALSLRGDYPPNRLEEK